MQLSEQHVDYFNRGVKYLGSKKWDKALSFFKKAVKGAPIKEVWLNMGNAYAQLDDEESALSCFLKAADPATPTSAGTFGPYELGENNLGLLHFRNGRDREAMEHYRRSIDLGEGKNGDPIWNLGNAFLKLCCSGKEHDWDRAWNLYRYRFFRTNPTPIDTRIEEWDRATHVQTLVVLSEQGQGDKIQFGRYLHLLRAYCNNLVVQVPNELKPIFEPMGYYCVEDVTPWVESGRSVAFCDLARIFGWNSAPAEWLDKSHYTPRTFTGTRPKILVEWKGSDGHANDRHRSITADYIQDLGKWGDLYSFKSKAPKGINALGTVPDWRASIEAILGSDLVVTIDTSIVHVCGSLGHPCIMIQPRKETDWRWGDDSMGETNIWYPSVSVIRNPCSWPKTFDRVHKKLEKLFAENKPT